MKAQLLLLLIVLALCILSCSEGDVATETLDDETPNDSSEVIFWKDTISLDCKLDTTSSLDSLLAYWKAHEPAHYSYQVRKNCFCSIYSFQFEVRDGVIDTVFFANEEDYEYYLGFGAEQVEYLLTTVAPSFVITELFTDLKYVRTLEPFFHQSYFHPEYGFPCSYWTNFEEALADEEYGYTVSDFVIAETKWVD